MEHYQDNSANQLPVVCYKEYRDIADQHDGLMRTGVCDQYTYDQVVNDPSTIYGLVNESQVPLVTSAGIFTNSSEPCARNVLPPEVLPDNLRKGIVSIEQFWLMPSDVHQILKPSEEFSFNHHKIDQLIKSSTDAEVLGRYGEAQFMVLAKYDVSSCDSMRANAPQDVITRSGHILTSNKSKITQHLPELIDLHESVFRRQAKQMGYYDGLSADMIHDMINSDNFIASACFDKDSGVPFMFAIFAIVGNDTSLTPWVNEPKLRSLTQDDEHAVISMPLVVSAKPHGLSVFPETVAHAMHNIVYRSQASGSIFTLTSANIRSILYTPQIMNRSIEAEGATLKDCIIEASALTQQPN